jgi:hypothetical protein
MHASSAPQQTLSSYWHNIIKSLNSLLSIMRANNVQNDTFRLSYSSNDFLQKSQNWFQILVAGSSFFN